MLTAKYLIDTCPPPPPPLVFCTNVLDFLSSVKEFFLIFVFTTLTELFKGSS